MADGRNNAVRVIDIFTGMVNTLAGLPPVDGQIDEEAYGDYGCGPEYADGPTAECADGIGPTAEFNRPRGVALDHATGLLYVLDKYGQIRSIYVGNTCSVLEDGDDSEGRGDSDEADSDEADSTAAASNDELVGLKIAIFVLAALTAGMVVTPELLRRCCG